MNYVLDQSLIVRVPIDSVMLSRIERRASIRGVLNSRTLVGGEGNFAGFAGEELLHSFLPILQNDSRSRDWDFVGPRGVTIDVKSKGNSKHAPRLDFDCTVPQYQVEAQNCHIYVFTRISADKTCGWLNGWISKDRFKREAKLRSEGTSYDNAGRATKDNHLVLTINRLSPMHKLKSYLLQGPNENGHPEHPAAPSPAPEHGLTARNQ